MDYMLLRDLVAQKVERATPLSSPTNTEQLVLQGSLWWSENDRTTNSHNKLRLISKEFDDLHLECNGFDVKSLDDVQFSLLFALNTCRDRYRLMKNPSIMNELVKVQCGSLVNLINVTGLPEKVPAVVQYVGPITGLSGRWFGVELTQPNQTMGSSDGEFKGRRYFHCLPNAGMFVPANKLRPCDHQLSVESASSAALRSDDCSLSSSSGSSYQDVRAPPADDQPSFTQPTNHPNVISMATGFNSQTESPELENPPEINIDDRCVYISDSGPELGVVKWIGVLPDFKHREYTIGVEFDNAIGTGTGKYNNQQLFRAKQNHASLVPALGLLKAEMYYGDNVPPPPPPASMEPVQHSEHLSPGMGGTRTSGSTHNDSRAINYRNKPVSSTGHSSADTQQGRFSTSTRRPLTSHQVPPHMTVRVGAEERSIYDQEPSHLYENMEKDERGRMGQAKSQSSGVTVQQRSQRGKDVAHGDLGSAYRMSDNSVVAQGSKEDKKYTNAPYLLGNSTFYGRHNDGGIMAPGGHQQHHSNGFDSGSHTLFSPTSYKTRIPESADGGDFHLPPGCEQPSQAPPHIVTHPSDHLIVDQSSRTQDVWSPLSQTQNNPTFSLVDVGTVQNQRDQNFVRGNYCKLTPASHKDVMQKGLGNELTGQRASENSNEDERFFSVNPRNISTELDIGSMVEVINGPPECRYGVVRWMGKEAGLRDKQKIIAGLEMEEEGSAFTDGNFGNTRCFHCPPNKAFFVYLHKLKPDSRFDESVSFIERRDSQVFGNQPCPDIEGVQAPPCVRSEGDLQRLLGKDRGIQGHHNSCYLDATLFSMFAFTTAFDSLLFRPRRSDDIEEYDQVQKVLREGIVNPLRANFFVRADKVLRLRTLLDKLSSIEGLMNEEKDPEEFLTGLLQQTLKMEPFIKLSSGQECYHYTLFMEKEDRILLPSTQDLLTLSFLQAALKFDKVPSVLMLQMPRFGKEYKMYGRIVPSLEIDITDMLRDGPRECTICGALATFECKDCFRHFGESLDKIAFCENCLKKSHVHAKRARHQPQPITIDPNYLSYVEELKKEGLPEPAIQREMLELFAVVCIHTSHFVTYVKCGKGLDAPWVFFDSMADRMGTQHGYNVPEVQQSHSLPGWLRDPDYTEIKSHSESKPLPEQMRRLLCDGYIAMYQSPSLLRHQ